MEGRVIAQRYRLQEPIGSGGMGRVWRAYDEVLDRTVAVKEVLLPFGIGKDGVEDLYQRTEREARYAARVSHPSIVIVYDVIKEDGLPWIVMEFVQSQSLDQIRRSEGPITALRAGRIGQQLLDPLAAAHTADIVPRDVTPQNV